MKTRPDMEKIAKGLGAVRRGKIPASAGYFGALQVAALLLEKTTEQLSGDEAEDLADAVLLRR
jgi:hypothetical protein